VEEHGQHAASRLTLARFVQLLGPNTVELLAAPPGGDVEVAGPRIYDPLEPGAIGRGDVVLGVNVASGSAGRSSVRRRADS